MKYFLVLFTLALFSCAHPQKEFKKEVNCSAKSQEYFLMESAKISDRLSKQNSTQDSSKAVELLNTKLQSFQGCYEEHVLHKGFRDSYNVCTIVRIDESSLVEYAYIDDATQGLDEKFRTCLNNEIKSLDFSAINAKDMVIMQAFNFYSVR